MYGGAVQVECGGSVNKRPRLRLHSRSDLLQGFATSAAPNSFRLLIPPNSGAYLLARATRPSG